MSKRPSLVKQVAQAFHGITAFGQSRHEAKRNKTALKQIFSYESLHSHQQRTITQLRRLPDDLRPKLLRDLSPVHIAWIRADMKQRGLSDTYIKNTLASFRKLGYALNQKGWNTFPPLELVPNTLYEGLRQPAPRGSYSAGDADRILAHVRQQPSGNDLALMLRLVQASGLRHSEIAHLRESNLDRERGILDVARTFAKGGRPRTVELDERVQTDIRSVLADIPAGRNWLWTDGHRLARDLQDAIREACEELDIAPKGMHGFRATFAERYVLRRIDEGATENDARLEVSHALGHGRVSVTYRYVPRLGSARQTRQRST